MASTTLHSTQGWSSFLSAPLRVRTKFTLLTNIPPQSRITSYSKLYSSPSDNKDWTKAGLNELQTLLREAVSSENYKEAAKLRDIIAEVLSESVLKEGNSNGEDPRKYQRLSWIGLGTAPWLVDRLEALDYALPTTIQIHAFESINQMLLQEQKNNKIGDSLSYSQQQTLGQLIDSTDAQRYGQERSSLAVIISGSTGSGKTLAYLVPLLSTLSESLFERQRIRVKSEADVTDAADDLLSRVAVLTSPEVRGRPGSDAINAEKRLRATMSMGKSGRDVTTPLSLIVVPTRELGVQTAMLLYELVGGSTKRTATEFSGDRNMFKYKGPKGVKIGCVLDDEQSEIGLKFQTDVVITIPKYLTKMLEEGDLKPEKLRVIVFDEADLALEQTSNDDLKTLFQVSRPEANEEDDDYQYSSSRLTYLVGASLQDINVVDFVLPDGKTYLATATTFGPLQKTSDGSEKQSLSHLHLRLDPGLIHERVVAPDNTGLLCLSRMLRKELKDYTTSLQNPKSDKKVASPRVVIFFPGEKEARACMPKLRDAMWGDFKLCVLLPDTGVNPMTVMEDFKQNKTSVMLATPNSVRGLDFAGLTHVYTLYLPANDPREYVHLAGRVGRIGQLGSASGTGGRVTSILRPEEADQMQDLAKSLEFDFIDVDYLKADIPSIEFASDDDEDLEGDDDEDILDKDQMEEYRRYLEDTITLLGEDVNIETPQFEDMDEEEPFYDSEEEKNSI